MTPTKSLMGLFIAFLLAAAPAAAYGPEDAVPIRVGGVRTLYIKGSVLDKLEPEGKFSVLFSDDKLATDSGLKIKRLPDDPPGTPRYEVNLLGNTADGNYRLSAKVLDKAPDPKDDAAGKPASVSQDAWDLVRASRISRPQRKPGAPLPPDLAKRDQELALALTQDQGTGQPNIFESIKKGGAQKIDAALDSADSTAAGLEAKTPGAKPADIAADLARRLKGSPEVADAAKGEEAGAGGKAKGTYDDDRIKALAPYFDGSKPEPLGDLIGRITQFMLNDGDGSGSPYFDDSVVVKPINLRDQVARLSAQQWVGLNSKQPQALAALYWVLHDGEQTLPGWLDPKDAGKLPVLLFLAQPKGRRDRLKKAMQDAITGNFIKKIKIQDDGLAFLGQAKDLGGAAIQTQGAAWQAATILSGEGVKLDELDAIRKRLGLTVPGSGCEPGASSCAPGEGGVRATGGAGLGAGDKLLASVSAFDFGGLYERGGVTGYIPIPDEPGKFRRISIKMYSSCPKAACGPEDYVNKIGIFDISNPGTKDAPPNIFGQRFSFPPPMDGVLRLDDRSPTGMKYALKIGEDGTIIFANEAGQGALKTADGKLPTVGGLMAMRKQQVEEEGNVWKVGDQTFKVIGQGGAKGTWLYFPCTQAPKSKDCALTGDNPGRSPALLAEINQVGSDGWPATIKDSKRPLGFSGMKEDGTTRQFWFLNWDEKTKAFAPEKGEPPAEEKKDEKKDGKDAKKTDRGGGSKGGDSTKKGSYSSTCSQDWIDRMLRSPDNKFVPHELTINSRKWSLLSSDGGGAFYLCINDKPFFANDVLVAGSPREESKDGKDYLVIETSKPSKDVSDAVLDNGQVTRDMMPGDPSPDATKWARREAYYIPLDNLAADKLTKAGEADNSAYPPKLAAVEVTYNNELPEISSHLYVFIRDVVNEPKKAVALVGDSIKSFGPGSMLEKFYKDDAKRKIIDGYVETEVGKYKGLEKPPPMQAAFDLDLYLDKDTQSLKTDRTLIDPSQKQAGFQKLIVALAGGLHLEVSKPTQK